MIILVVLQAVGNQSRLGNVNGVIVIVYIVLRVHCLLPSRVYSTYSTHGACNFSFKEEVFKMKRLLDFVCAFL